jgi:hypothetical protein
MAHLRKQCFLNISTNEAELADYAVEVAYTKGLVPTRCFLNTTAPVLVWNTQQIEFRMALLSEFLSGRCNGSC